MSKLSSEHFTILKSAWTSVFSWCFSRSTCVHMPRGISNINLFFLSLTQWVLPDNGVKGLALNEDRTVVSPETRSSRMCCITSWMTHFTVRKSKLKQNCITQYTSTFFPFFNWSYTPDTILLKCKRNKKKPVHLSIKQWF